MSAVVRAACLAAALALAGCSGDGRDTAAGGGADQAVLPQPQADSGSITGMPPVGTPTELPAEAPQPPPAEAVQDWTLPGAFRAGDTRQALEQRFGADNVRAQTLHGPEGAELPGLVLFPDDPRQRLEIIRNGNGPGAGIDLITLRDRATRWRVSGLRPGMSLDELVAANGAPVSFYGFSWDYGGALEDWHGGRLANGPGGSTLQVMLEPAGGEDAADLPQGDSTFRSDDPHWPGLGTRVVIGEISVFWPGDGG